MNKKAIAYGFHREKRAADRCLEVGNHHLKPTGAKAGTGHGLRLEFVCKRCRQRFWRPPQLRLFADSLKAEVKAPVKP